MNIYKYKEDQPVGACCLTTTGIENFIYNIYTFYSHCMQFVAEKKN